MLGLTLRVLLSLAAVLCLLWLAARVLRGPLAGRGGGVLDVLARQQLGRNVSVAVVRVADRALVLGVSEHGVNLLTETDLPPAEGPAVDAVPDGSGGPRAGTLDGSVLSPKVWRQAADALRERTVRRG